MISIVVPVYKVERYLSQCVESLLQQTYSDTEIILIDDGSPDGSGVLCDELSATDARIKVFHQANKSSEALVQKGLSWLRVNGFVLLIRMILFHVMR